MHSSTYVTLEYDPTETTTTAEKIREVFLQLPVEEKQQLVFKDAGAVFLFTGCDRRMLFATVARAIYKAILCKAY